MKTYLFIIIITIIIIIIIYQTSVTILETFFHYLSNEYSNGDIIFCSLKFMAWLIDWLTSLVEQRLSWEPDIYSCGKNSPAFYGTHLFITVFTRAATCPYPELV